MREHTKLMIAVVLGTGTGCPTEWAMDGVVDRAVRKDVRELQSIDCGEGRRAVKPPPGCQGENCKPKCVEVD